MQNIEVQGTMSGGSSRNHVRVEMAPSSDGRTLRISFDHRGARVSACALLDALAKLPQTGEVLLPASGGAEGVLLAPKSNTVQIELVRAQGTGFRPVVRVGRTILRQALRSALAT